MNESAFPGDEFELLLLRLIDGEATDADRAAFSEAIAASPELHKRAFLYFCDESLLADELSGDRMASSLSAAAFTDPGAASPGKGEATRTAGRFAPRSALSALNRRGLAVAAVAALVIVGLLTHNLVMMKKISRLHAIVVQSEAETPVHIVAEAGDAPAAPDSKSRRGKNVGRVIGLYDPEWPEGAAVLTYGDTIDEGQSIELTSGGIEILLANGAKVAATGPVDFELSSLLMMDMEKGKVVAAVPRTARGYTIVTPTSELVDIGTQFGVAVAESGDTELHVFDGDVVARSRVDSASTELVHAKENEAIRFRTAHSELERFTAKESDFVRQFGPQPPLAELPPLPHAEGLCLWLAADAVVDVPEGDPVTVWRDIRVGDNRLANDARQFDAVRCPKFVTDGVGRKALRFNGRTTSMQIDPMDNSGCFTCFLACAPAPTSYANDVHGGMLFKFGMAPSLELSILPDRTPRSWIWPGPGFEDVAIVRGSSVPDSQASFITYLYNSAESHSQLWVDGVSQAESDAPVSLRPGDTAFLGSHGDPLIDAYYFGNVYEVVVYDKALSPEALSDVHDYMTTRYKTDQDD